MWKNRGDEKDLAKARAYAAEQSGERPHHVFTYPTSERDPLGRAKKDVTATSLLGYSPVEVQSTVSVTRNKAPGMLDLFSVLIWARVHGLRKVVGRGEAPHASRGVPSGTTPSRLRGEAVPAQHGSHGLQAAPHRIRRDVRPSAGAVAGVSLLGTSPPGPVLLRRCRWIAKCKACGIATSRTSSADEARRAPHGDNVYVYAQPKGAPHLNVEGSYVIDCRQCHKPRRATEVRGRYSEKEVCSAKCTSSTGFTCECQCSGKNHGKLFDPGEAGFSSERVSQVESKRRSSAAAREANRAREAAESRARDEARRAADEPWFAFIRTRGVGGDDFSRIQSFGGYTAAREAFKRSQG